MTAMMMAVRKCEGTDDPDGYRALFGYRPGNGKVFASFADHPRIKTAFRQSDGVINFTTAAGAGQIIVPTWDRLQKKLRLPDFSPTSQDIAMVELFKECGALVEIHVGAFQAAIDHCAKVWASLPSSQYPQPKRALEFAVKAYTDALDRMA